MNTAALSLNHVQDDIIDIKCGKMSNMFFLKSKILNLDCLAYTSNHQEMSSGVQENSSG